jgi:hypothetical protein
VFLVLAVGIGAGLRVYRIETGLWFDEIVTLLDSVRHSLGTIVTHFPGDNDHPLYSVLAHIFVRVLGETPLALRAPAMLFGIATIPMLYVVGRSVVGRQEAAAATVILTVSYHHIWFSQNARAYTLLMLSVLLSTHALVRWLDAGRTSWLALYALATALGAYGHLTMAVASAGQALACGLAWIWSDRQGRLELEWGRLAAAFGTAACLTIALYAPMLTEMGSLLGAAGVDAPVAATTPMAALSSALEGLQAGFEALWAIAIGSAIAAVGAYSLLRERTMVALLLLVPAPLVVLAAMALQRPIRPRFVFFAMGFALLLAVKGASVTGRLLSRLGNGRLPEAFASGVVVAALTIGAVAFSMRSLPRLYRLPKQDFASAVAFVERARRADEPVALVGETAATPIARYLGRPWTRIETYNDLQALRAGSPVWVVYTFPSYIVARRPELWQALQDSCAPAADFEGTVAGGTVSVLRCS